MCTPWFCGVVPVVAGAGGEPAAPAGEVDAQRDRDERDRQPAGRRGSAAADERRQPGGPARADVPRGDQRGEAEDVPGARSTWWPRPGRGRARPPPATGGSRTWARAAPPCRRATPSASCARPSVPVDQDAAERGQHEEHQEDVQDPGPGQHELQPVQRHAAARRRSPAASSGSSAGRSGRSAGWPASRTPRWRTASRRGSARTATRPPRSAACRPRAGPRTPRRPRSRCTGRRCSCAPAWMIELALLTRVSSTPWFRMLQASLA